MCLTSDVVHCARFARCGRPPIDVGHYSIYVRRFRSIPIGTIGNSAQNVLDAYCIYVCSSICDVDMCGVS